MYAKWLQCGGQPQQSEVTILGDVQNYSMAPKFALLRGERAYFCDAREAELAGYSAEATGYSFPHLNRDEARNVLDKK